MRRFAIGFSLWIASCISCTAADKATLRDCLSTVGESQLFLAAESAILCNEDRACIDFEIHRRAMLSADAIAACVESRKDAATQ